MKTQIIKGMTQKEFSWINKQMIHKIIKNKQKIYLRHTHIPRKYFEKEHEWWLLFAKCECENTILLVSSAVAKVFVVINN